MDKEEFLKQSFAFYKINLTQTQIDKFLSFYKFLIEENQKFNLTAITDFEEVVFKHFIDSCLPFQDFKQNSFVVDVGSGAGFPALPLKILRDDLKIVMIGQEYKTSAYMMIIMKKNIKMNGLQKHIC